MSLQLSRTVNFGSRKSGLSTVGYALYDSDNALHTARTIVGVTEIGSVGIYQVLVEVEDAFIGTILWDTGDATILYASENVDYRNISLGGGTVVVSGVFDDKEKKKLFKLLDKLLKNVAKIKQPDIDKVEKTIGELEESSSKKMNMIKHLMEAQGKPVLLHLEASEQLMKSLQEDINTLGSALEALIEYKEFKNIVQEVEDHAKVENARIED